MPDATGDAKPTCFIAMPITTSDAHVEKYGDREHWLHVMDVLFKPAIEAAGYAPVSPLAVGADMIHARIIEHLEKAEMVLCDLSSLNPNVMFELGIRTALDLPIAVVAETGTRLPFDTAVINTHFYDPALRSWEVSTQVDALCTYLRSSTPEGTGSNPLWKHFGLTKRAKEASVNETPEQALIDLRLAELTEQVRDLRDAVSSPGPVDSSELSPMALSRFAQVAQPQANRHIVTSQASTADARLIRELRDRVAQYNGVLNYTPGAGTGIIKFPSPLTPAQIAHLREVTDRSEVHFFVSVNPEDPSDMLSLGKIRTS